jgi:hypothetical protein
MRDFIQIVEEKAKIKRQANIIIVQEDYAENKPKDFMKKINNFIERFSFDESVEDILTKIKKDKLFAAHFAKDPGRQNLYELTQLEELSKHCEVKKLSNTGRNALYINDSKISSIKDRTKSLDAIINNTYYATLKYTKDDGGSQDNQKADIVLTLEEAKTCKENFAVIVDGTYWQKRLPELKSKYAEYENLWIGTTDDWIKENSEGSV